MEKYSVKQLSKLAGVSIRTLHHYDRIGLLKPAFRSEKGYRFYGREELLLLQQILFYKTLGFPLQEIKEVIYDPDFDLISALAQHKRQLLKQAKQLKRLLKTIDKTMNMLQNKSENIMKDEELYDGFSTTEIEQMRQEVTEKWGEVELLAVEARIRELGSEGWDDHKRKGENITQLLADLMVLPPDDKRVQKAIALYHQHLNFYYEVSKERFLGLGQMYVEDARFTAHYEKYRKGLAVFIRKGIEIYCANDMTVVD